MSSDPQTRVREALRAHIDSLPTAGGDVDAVLARARRPSLTSPPRRRVRWLAPAGAAIAVAAAITAAVVVPRYGESPPARSAIPWLPVEIAAPEEEPPPLPDDRGVGPGSVVYAPLCDRQKPATCKEYLITEDGAHYHIPGTSDKYGNQDDSATLSPDGRWLGVTRPGEFQLRDLTSARVHTVDGEGVAPRAWSPDGRWLVVSGKSLVWRVDTRTGELRRVQAPFRVDGRTVLDVTHAGEVLLSRPDARCVSVNMCGPIRNEVGELALVDPDKGELIWKRKFGGDPPPGGDRWKGTHPLSVRLTPDDRSLLVALGKTVEAPDGRSGDFTSGDLLVFDLVTAAKTRRYDIIDGTVLFYQPSGRPGGSTREQFWRLFAYEGDGILLLGGKAFDSWDDTSPQISQVDPDTGKQRVVTRAPELKLIAVRGSINIRP